MSSNITFNASTGSNLNPEAATFSLSVSADSVKDKAQNTVNYHLTHSLPLANLWLDARGSMDHLRAAEPYQQYLREICNITGQMLWAAPKPQSEQSDDQGRESVDIILTTPARGVAAPASSSTCFNAKASTFNPLAAIFTPPSPKKVAPHTGAQGFKERCKKLGVRISSAFPGKTTTPEPVAASVSKTPAEKFHEKCRLHGVRLSSSMK